MTIRTTLALVHSITITITVMTVLTERVMPLVAFLVILEN